MYQSEFQREKGMAINISLIFIYVNMLVTSVGGLSQTRKDNNIAKFGKKSFILKVNTAMTSESLKQFENRLQY